MTQLPRRSRSVRAVVSILVMVLVAAGCANDDDGGSPDASGDGIKIGFITVTEGPFAANGEDARQGVRYAVERLNDRGGIDGTPVELVEADTRGDPQAMANIVRRMALEDGVVAIVGPVVSAECEVGCPLANELEVPMISPGAGQPGVVENARPYAFTLVEPDGENSAPAAEAILTEEGIETGAIIVNEGEAVTQALEDFWVQAYADAGVELVDTVTYTTGDSSFGAQMTQLASSQPDGLALAASPSEAAQIALAAERQGLDVQLLGTGILQSAGQEYIDAGGAAVEGTKTAAQFDPDNPDPMVQELINGYLESTGEGEVTLNAAYSFDAVNIIAQILTENGVDDARQKIKDALPGIDDFLGMGGITDIGEDGVTNRPIQVATVENGQFVIEQVDR